MSGSKPVLLLNGKTPKTLSEKFWRCMLPPGDVLVLAVFPDETIRLMKYDSSHKLDVSHFIYLGYKHPRERLRSPEENFIDRDAFNERYRRLGVSWDDLSEVICSRDPMGKEITTK